MFGLFVIGNWSFCQDLCVCVFSSFFFGFFLSSSSVKTNNVALVWERDCIWFYLNIYSHCILEWQDLILIKDRLFEGLGFPILDRSLWHHVVFGCHVTTNVGVTRVDVLLMFTQSTTRANYNKVSWLFFLVDYRYQRSRFSNNQNLTVDNKESNNSRMPPKKNGTATSGLDLATESFKR